jgi:tripartite-type tricarboxylate transporter receptor subunit TctC
LISGNIDCAFETRFLSAALASEQKIRILAVSGLARDPIAPDGKLFSDIIPSLTFYNWSGVSISKSTPQIERDRIFSALRRMPQDKAYRTSMDSLGVEVVENPMVNDTWLNSEYQRFETMRQQIGLSKID